MRLGVLQNSSLALGILREPVQAGRWVDRHGHTAGEERTEEGVKEILLGPEHEPDRIPPPDASRGEAGGDRHRARPELPIGDRPLAPVGLLEEHVDAPGIGLGVPAQDIGERAERGGRGHPRGGGRRRLEHDRRGHRPGRSNRVGDGPWGLRLLHAGVGQEHTERLLEAEEQFDALQAAQAEVAVQGRVKGDGGALDRPPVAHISTRIRVSVASTPGAR